MKFITKFAINSLFIALSPWLLSGAVHAQAVVPSIKAESASKSSVTHANVTISDSWVRPTVAGQKATGAFMKITAKENSKLSSLTKREREILKLIADGMSYKEIGNELFISVRTVETHKNNILQKLELKSTIDLV